MPIFSHSYFPLTFSALGVAHSAYELIESGLITTTVVTPKLQT